MCIRDRINELKTPCYVIDEGKLTENLKILHHVMPVSYTHLIWTVLSESVSGRPARSRNWLIPCKRDHSGTKLSLIHI